jgi:hypothetical protein
MPSQRTSPARVRKAVRQNQAVELRLAGATYRQIAETLDVNIKVAWQYVTDAMQQTARQTENVLQLQQIEVARLDRLQMRAWQKYESTGDIESALLIIRIIRTRADILGLRQVNVNMTVTQVPTFDQLDAELAAYRQGLDDAIEVESTDNE